MLDLRQLQYFVAVAENLSFTKAARALYIGQPSLSAQVHQLELSLGVDLLIRTTRRVELTPAGDALLPRARALLAGAERAATGARDAAASAPVRLDIQYDGCPTGAAIISELIAAGCPPSAVDVQHRGGVAAQVPRLRSRALDAGIGLAWHLPDDLEHEVVQFDAMGVGSRSERFAGVDTLRPQDLEGTVLLVPDGAGTAPEWVDFGVRRCGGVPAPQGSPTGTTFLTTAPPEETYVVHMSSAPLTALSGWTCAEVLGWPAFPWSVIWLRGRRDDRAVRAVRAAARAAAARADWLPSRPPVAPPPARGRALTR